VPDLDVGVAGRPQQPVVQQHRVVERAAVLRVHAPDGKAVTARARRAQDLAQDHAGVVAADEEVSRLLEPQRVGRRRVVERDLDDLDAGRGRIVDAVGGRVRGVL
jgi:hypothetical protein